MFDAQSFIKDTILFLRERIKDRALIACSGGVDSTVTAVLVNRAIGKNLVTLHVDTGLMRKNESQKAKKLLKKYGFKPKICRCKRQILFCIEGNNRSRGETENNW